MKNSDVDSKTSLLSCSCRSEMKNKKQNAFTSYSILFTFVKMDLPPALTHTSAFSWKEWTAKNDS